MSLVGQISKIQILVHIPKMSHVENEENPIRNKKMGRSDISRKIEKSQKGSTLRGHHGTSVNWFEIMGMATDIVGKSTKMVPKTA
jgi:hypothetical protein